MKLPHSCNCSGLSWVTGSGCLERNIAVQFFRMYGFLALGRPVADASKVWQPAPKQSWHAAWTLQCSESPSSLLLLYIIYSKCFIICDRSHDQTDGLSSSWTLERLRESGGWMKRKKQYCYDVRKTVQLHSWEVRKNSTSKHTQEERCSKSLWLPSTLCTALLSSVSLCCCKSRQLRHCCWLTGNIIIKLCWWWSGWQRQLVVGLNHLDPERCRTQGNL